MHRTLGQETRWPLSGITNTNEWELFSTAKKGVPKTTTNRTEVLLNIAYHYIIHYTGGPND